MPLRCAVGSIKRGCLKRNIYILSVTQAAIKALDNYKINSKLVWDCHQSLMILAECNIVQLLWELEDKGIEGNETAHQLARRGLLRPFIRPEYACSISDRVKTWRVGTQNAFSLSSLLKGHLSS
jgi:hypothetical protein